MILENIADLKGFREELHAAENMRNLEHIQRHDLDKYDCIDHPKPSCYRGIHNVFKHIPRSHRRSDDVRPWDGPLVEI